MALDFPLNPTNGQVYENYYYDSSITAWRSAGSKTGVNQRTTALELADRTTNKSGLVPVVPTSVSVVSGSASLSGATVTLAGISSVSLGGVFHSGYSNYEVIFTPTGASGSASVFMRLSTGTIAADANYVYAISGITTSGTVIAASSTGNTYFYLGDTDTATDRFSSKATIYSPNNARRTVASWNGMILSGGAYAGIRGNGFYNLTTQFTGLALVLSAGTISGTVTVYGYNS